MNDPAQKYYKGRRNKFSRIDLWVCVCVVLIWILPNVLRELRMLLQEQRPRFQPPPSRIQSQQPRIQELSKPDRAIDAKQQDSDPTDVKSWIRILEQNTRVSALMPPTPPTRSSEFGSTVASVQAGWTCFLLNSDEGDRYKRNSIVDGCNAALRAIVAAKSIHPEEPVQPEDVECNGFTGKKVVFHYRTGTSQLSVAEFRSFHLNGRIAVIGIRISNALLENSPEKWVILREHFFNSMQPNFKLTKPNAVIR